MPNRTFLANLVNPQVLADMVNAKLEAAIKFAPLAVIDRTLQGRPGNTLTMPKYTYIGDAEDVAEGDPIPVDRLGTTDATVTVKKAGKGVELTDESLLSGYGDPMGQAEMQLRMAIANKVDNDVITVLHNIAAPMVHDVPAENLSVDVVADALVKFGEEIEGPMVLFIAPRQLATFRKSEEFVRASDLGDSVIMTGTVGAVLGCQIVVSNKVKSVNGEYENYIVKPGAISIFMKREAEAEADRDIINKSTVVTIDQHYVTYLSDETKAIKIITLGVPEVDPGEDPGEDLIVGE